MKVYNTLTKKIEEFVPHQEGIVNMYTCGPTVYNYAHIGNFRTYIFEDILEKTLHLLGYKVNRVMNITDVGHMTSDADTGEDKMLKGAKRENKTVYEIADFYTDAFFKDMDALRIKRPDTIEKASMHIDKYIEIVEKLLQDGYAYQAGGNVYFDICKIENYYELSGRSKEELMVAVREDVEEDLEKRNPYDFGLWFTISKFEDQIMKWDSPWGVGYPGWHIECSGIALTYLGEYLDIHCGAVDNIFPHHTNEIAQSEAFLGHKWCKYWMHGEFLNDKNGKMAKSSGEFLTVSYLQKRGYNPIVYRFFCLNSHYRKTLEFSFDALDQAKVTYEKLLHKIRSLKKEEKKDIQNDIKEKYLKEFSLALANDLNTSSALTVLYDTLKSDCFASTKLAIIEEMDQVLSLDLLKEDRQNIDASFQEYIEQKIKERNEAKKNKEYEKADKIRKELLDKNVILKDTREGTFYEIGR